MTRLVKPDLDHLDRYIEALERGWSPDNIRGKVAADEQLAKIATDALDFVNGLEDREAKQPGWKAPDGTLMRRLPGFFRWIWDDDFCGSISLRWEPGTSDLPPHVLGHIGYAVVPWKEGKGHATEALRQILPMAREVGLSEVILTANPGNPASHRVIYKNGGELVGPFTKPEVYGGGEGLKFRIAL